MKVANNNRWGHRDATAILLAYRHGLRASELVALRWDDIELATGEKAALLDQPHTADVRAHETSQFHVADASALRGRCIGISVYGHNG